VTPSRRVLKVKVIGQSSRSQEDNVAKVYGATSSKVFLVVVVVVVVVFVKMDAIEAPYSFYKSRALNSKV